MLSILTNGSNVSMSLILLPLRLRYCKFGHPFNRFRLPDILLSLSSSWKQEMYLAVKVKTIMIRNTWIINNYIDIMPHFTGQISTQHMLAQNIEEFDFVTFRRFGRLGKPFSVVRPTLMRLRDSRSLKSSVKPSICVARQLSRFKSLIWTHTKNKCKL